MPPRSRFIRAAQFGAVALTAGTTLLLATPKATPADPAAEAAQVTEQFMTAVSVGNSARACALTDPVGKADMEASGMSCEAIVTRISADPTNAAIYRRWAQSGIETSAVTVTGERALVSLPPHGVATLVKNADGNWRVQSVG